MAIPILHFWENYYSQPDEGLGSTYERFIINKVLFKTIKHFRINSVMESPLFGFTGLSGINSLALGLKGLDITLVDHDSYRLDKIRQTWLEVNLNPTLICTENYAHLPLEDHSVDMSWNFSALWFVDNLKEYLTELDRLSRKVVLLMVPNQTGIGYLHQKYTGQDDLKRLLKEENIHTPTIKQIMKQLGWKLLDHRYIDCPPWPDIGMSKEKFLKKVKLGFLVKTPQVTKKPVTIMDYYTGKEPEMMQQFEKYEILEKTAPVAFKKIWSHHQYLLFYK